MTRSLAMPLVLMCSLAHAGEAADCESANTHDIRDCARQALAVADTELNRTYQELLVNLRKAEEDWLRPKDSLVAPLKKAQKAWMVFRDSNCAFLYEQINGTMAAAAEMTCQKEMTASRTAELRRAFMEPP